METTENEISVAEFLSAGIYLAEQSGRLIRDVWNSGKLSTTEKDYGEGPVTEADLRVQRTIEYNFKQLFPSLTIQGEEDPATYAHYQPVLQPEEVNKSLIS